MKDYYKKDEWLIIEEGFNPGFNRSSESIFSIGNGYMGQRANFEEHYSGDSLQGSYIAGIYYPDKTKVGWWKNGYPDYYAKVLNAPKWIGIDIAINKKPVDLSLSRITSFTRILNMKKGYLDRYFTVNVPGKKSLEFHSRRFLSMREPDAGIIKYSVRSVDFEGYIDFCLYLDSAVRNDDAYYGKRFWREVRREINEESGIIIARTLKTGFYVATGMCSDVIRNNEIIKARSSFTGRKNYVAHSFAEKIKPGDEITVIKYVSVLSTLNNPRQSLMDDVKERLRELRIKGYERLFGEHTAEWDRIWESSDVVVEGDVAAQQAIRFNIFHLNQTYTGKDDRLNIGPKGFTGEKYGGVTYWDTEAFVLPFFLKTADQNVSRNLLLYRYKHLDASIKNALKLGFIDGAALYPMVTMDGEECHSEWEITFEEIHRNGAIAYAIYNYIKHTGDESYIADYGLEVLIAISRFWSQRVTWSGFRNKYVILGVTGPNEYENNVNNNWYTNLMAVWTLSYTISNLQKVKKESAPRYMELIRKTNFEFAAETSCWQRIIDNMYFPFDNERNIFLQHDNFLDKELIPADSIPEKERPINQHWSWDRILRSCFIKQSDVLQGLYVFEDKYDTETIRRNFEFYEPMTVHESSLSAGIHSILASRIGEIDKAYELFCRTARIDLDDYNKETGEGLHITGMAGAWLAIAEGFGGMRINDDRLIINPLIPPQWKSYSFNARFRGMPFKVIVSQNDLTVVNLSEKLLKITIFGEEYHISGSSEKSVLLESVNPSKPG